VEDDDIENVALAVTSDFQDDAQTLSASASNLHITFKHSYLGRTMLMGH
jgi:hypothetical protein